MAAHSSWLILDDVSFLGFSDDSALLKHELAYCLGQIKNEAALPVLETVLRDKAEDPMVRHEVGAYVHFFLLHDADAREAGCGSHGGYFSFIIARSSTRVLE